METSKNNNKNASEDKTLQSVSLKIVVRQSWTLSF